MAGTNDVNGKLLAGTALAAVAVTVAIMNRERLLEGESNGQPQLAGEQLVTPQGLSAETVSQAQATATAAGSGSGSADTPAETNFRDGAATASLATGSTPGNLDSPAATSLASVSAQTEETADARRTSATPDDENESSAHDNARDALERATPLCWQQTTNLPENYYAVARDRDVVFSGESSARLFHEFDEARAATLQQSINALEYAGKRVELSAFLKYDLIEGYGVDLWLHAVDARGNMLANVRSPHATGALGWHSRSIFIDLPPETAMLRLAVTLGMHGTVWVDDVRLTAIGEADLSTYKAGEFKGIAPVPNVEALLKEPCNLDFELWQD